MSTQDMSDTQPPSARSGADCRVYERQPCVLPATCQPASASEMRETRWPASIHDISQGGVLIFLARRFEKGTGLALELPGDTEGEAYVVFVKVVHLKPSDGAWVLGCKFISPLGDDELQRLLSLTNHVLSTAKEIFVDDEEVGEMV